MSCTTLKKIKRYVSDDRVNLEKTDEGYFISYLQKFNERYDLRKTILGWNVENFNFDKENHRPVETDLGWKHKIKIDSKWLNADRIAALDKVIQEKAQNDKVRD